MTVALILIFAVFILFMFLTRGMRHGAPRHSRGPRRRHDIFPPHHTSTNYHHTHLHSPTHQDAFGSHAAGLAATAAHDPGGAYDSSYSSGYDSSPSGHDSGSAGGFSFGGGGDFGGGGGFDSGGGGSSDSGGGSSSW